MSERSAIAGKGPKRRNRDSTLSFGAIVSFFIIIPFSL